MLYLGFAKRTQRVLYHPIQNVQTPYLKMGSCYGDIKSPNTLFVNQLPSQKAQVYFTIDQLGRTTPVMPN